MKRWHILLLDAVLLTLIPIVGLLARWMMDAVPACIFLERGIRCPSCGGSRCVLYLTQFRFADAFRMNPFYFSTAMVCLALILFLNISVLLQWQKGMRIFKKVCRPYLVILWAIGYAVFGFIRMFLL